MMTGEKNLSLIDPKEVRRFGIAALMFFGAPAGISIWRAKFYPGAVFGPLAAIGFYCLVFPSQAAPLYRIWMAVARRIGTGFTTVTLVMAYYLVITPVALIKRYFNGRPLPMSPDPEKASYWQNRSVPAQPPERFSKRY
jgi:hypothetical protein